MSRKKIAIIHFYPMEYFPPVTNLLDYFSYNFPEFKVSALSTNNNKNRKVYKQNRIKILRFPFPKPNDPSFIRFLKYSCFFVSSLWHLIVKKPDTVIYYETISSWPVYVYSKYINQKCQVIIHFHEYASLSWYNRHMKLVRYFHTLEKAYLYNRAEWISQTNHFRLSLFHKDYPELTDQKLRVLPNYPPKEWSSKTSSDNKQSPLLKIVYIGSISFEGSFIHEFCNWVNSQPNITFDVYSYNVHEDVKVYLNQFKNSKINFFERGIDYLEIPNLLKSYDVGVILHKAYNENYKYNATNKLFEYLICDLDVWFPNELLGCNEFSTTTTWPKVIGLDFRNLDKCNINTLVDKNTLSYRPKHYFYEETFGALVNVLLK